MRFFPRRFAASAACRPASPRARLHALPLERRDVPATFTVTSTADGSATVAGTLRWAVAQANASTTTADTVAFDAATFASPQTITLTAGQLAATGPVAIVGPASSVTLTASPANRLLNVSGKAAVQVSDIAFVGGSSNTGAAINVVAADLSVTRCRFSNNKASADGGAINTAGRTLSIAGCTFVGNTAQSSGGAIFLNTDTSGASLTVTLADSTFTANTARTFGGVLSSNGLAGIALAVSRSTLANNTAGGAGGAIDLFNGTALSIADSALVGNSAGSGGGAVNFASFITPQTPSITFAVVNSTLAQNTASYGGAVASASSAPLTLRNSTVAGNRANGVGGGFYIEGKSPPPITVVSSVVGGNQSSSGNDFDLSAGGPVAIAAATYSAFGGAANLSIPPSPTNVPLGTPLGLALTLDTTGPRPGLLPVPGSPLLDAGANPLGLTADARGLARTVGAGIDIGAGERTPGPAVAAVAYPTIVPNATSATVTVTFADDQTGAVAASSVAGNKAAITVTGPTGVLTITAATLDVPTDGSPRTVAYQFAPPGGAWDGADFGVYTVTLNGGQAKNTAGVAVPGAILGTFTVRYTQTFTVTNLLDNAVGSFRLAIAQANAAPGTFDTIAFAPGLSGTVTLAGQVTASDSVAVTGAGAAVTLTGAAGVLNLSGTASVALSDFTIRGAKATAGAALVVAGYTAASLTRMVIADNTTTAAGPGGAILSNGGLTITDSTLTNNVGSGSGTFGGAVAAALVTVSRSVFQGNAAVRGGAIYRIGDTASVGIEDSLLVGNMASDVGGAVYATSVTAVRNSTLAGNTAGTAGGAIYTPGVVVGLDNSTVVGNAAGQGGGVYAGAGAAVSSTILAGNTATGGGPDLFVGGTVTLDRTLIGVGDSGFTGASETATLKGTLAAPLDPQLGPLQNNGGPTLTRAPLSGSPVIDQGANRLNAPYDQRGVGYARAVGAATDIGAVEAQPPAVPDTLPPTVTLVNAYNVTTRNGGSYTVTFNLVDNYTVDAATVQPADFTLTGPNGFAAAATAVALAATNPLTATVTFTPPGGTWTADDNGTYTVSLTGPVLDVNGLAAAAGPRGTFTVAAPVGIASVVAVLPDGTTTPLSTAGQRSAIPTLRVLFDGPATGADAAAAYKLVTGTTTVPVTVSTVTVNGRTQATLTPAAPLADGTYTFTALAQAITTANLPGAVQLAGLNDGYAGNNYARSFSRYLADFDGDTAVDGNDLAIFATAYNSVAGDGNYRAYLDLDGDGAVDGNDLAIFAQRFNTVL